MKILQINSVVNSGSTGRIAEDIGKVLITHGHESYIAYGRGSRPSASKLLKIGNNFDIYMHGLKTLVLDRHGFGSVNATRELIKQIDSIKPDAIGLHNIHGYYLNIGLLFDYLAMANIPVLWTLFSCWSFTGHCSYFDDIGCEKWKQHCNQCPKKNNYPSSYFLDNSFRNFSDKKKLFTSLNQIEIVVHSKWLGEMVKSSFLSHIPIHTLPSGIDLDIFKPTLSDFKEKSGLSAKKIILGCASPWSKRKGLNDFILLRKSLSEEYQIVLIGLNEKQSKDMPGGITGILRTESVEELAAWYSAADVFVNPTYQDNFPTTNIEALACGTPVVTYNTGGSPEAIDNETGISVRKADISGLKSSIEKIISIGKPHYLPLCRKRAEEYFNMDDRYVEYLNIFTRMVQRNN